MDKDSNQNFTKQDSEFNIKEILFKYVSYWYYFILSIIVCLLVAFLYLRYTVPKYSATATLLVKDDKKGGLVSEMASFSEIDMLGKIKNTVDNEIEIIKSRTIVGLAVKELKLNVSYFNEGRLKTSDLYNDTPIRIIFKDTTQRNLTAFKVKSSDGKSYSLYNQEDKLINKYKFGQFITYNKLNFAVINIDEDNRDIDTYVIIKSLANTIQSYYKKLSVKTLSDNTSVVELSIVDPVKERAEDFLNSVIKNYNHDAVEDKNQIFENTSRFIEVRLKIISTELDTVEKTAENYKIENRITDITSEAGCYRKPKNRTYTRKYSYYQFC